MRAPGTPVVAIDAHVHFPTRAHDGDTLAAAARNFAAACPVPTRTGVLMLAEAAREDAFPRLRAHGVVPGGEATSAWIRAGDWRLLVVAGRQIVTAERIEVLALGTTARIEDGLPLARALQRIDAEDALPVLPWGAGKWLGARGRAVVQALSGATPNRLFVGDNAGRPALWHDRVLREAAARGFAPLPGTDPLPLPGAWSRVGSFGFALAVVLSEEAPAQDLKRALRAGVRPVPFGRPATLPGFLRDQLRLRLRRRPAGAPEAA